MRCDLSASDEALSDWQLAEAIFVVDGLTCVRLRQGYAGLVLVKDQTSEFASESLTLACRVFGTAVILMGLVPPREAVGYICLDKLLWQPQMTAKAFWLLT